MSQKDLTPIFSARKAGVIDALVSLTHLVRGGHVFEVDKILFTKLRLRDF